MRDKKIYQKIKKKSYRDGFWYPLYENYTFANLPSTILDFYGIPSETTLPKNIWKPRFDPETYQNIILLYLDGLSYTYWMQHLQSFPFFRTITKKGSICPLTSIFPSTTAAALTSLITGLSPAKHGLLEWYLYLEELDSVIKSIPFTYFGSSHRDALKEDFDPAALFEGDPIFHTLRSQGVSSYTFLQKKYVSGCYSQQAYKGSTRISYISASDLSVRLRKKVNSACKPTFFFVYWGLTDYLGHVYGSPQEEEYVEYLSFQFLFLKEFLKKLHSSVANNTLLIVTSDHGLSSNPENIVFLNEIPSVNNNLLKDKFDITLVTGSPRATFLHLKNSSIDTVREVFSHHSGIKVKTKKEIMDERLLGGTLKQKFRDRLGDLILLPNKKHWTWYKHTEQEHLFKSYHGGLTQREMIIPLGMIPCDAFKKSSLL